MDINKERSEFKFTLGRKIDINYKTNRYLIIAMIFIASLVSVISGSLKQSLFTAIGFFFAWALTREIDPLKEYAAFISGLLALIIILFYDGVNLAPLFFLLIATRFVSGICGYKPTYVDILSLFLLAGYLTYSKENSIYFFILTLMFATSWFRYLKDKIYLAGTSIGFLLSIIFFFIYPIKEIFLSLPFNWKIIPFVLTMILLITLFLALSFNKDKGIKDDLGGDIESHVIVKTLIFYSLTIILFILFENLTQSTLIILLSTITGAGIWRLLVQKKMIRSGSIWLKLYMKEKLLLNRITLF